jgi:hypothetical protein
MKDREIRERGLAVCELLSDGGALRERNRYLLSGIRFVRDTLREL